MTLSIGQLFFSFEGRIDRSQFWGAYTPLFLAALLVRILILDSPSALMSNPGTLIGAAVATPFLVWMLLAVQAKRFHDRNKSGAWSCIASVPFLGWLWLIVELGFLRGTDGPNRFDAIALPPANTLESATATNEPVPSAPTERLLREVEEHRSLPSTTPNTDGQLSNREESFVSAVRGKHSELNVHFSKSTARWRLGLTHFGTPAASAFDELIRLGSGAEEAFHTVDSEQRKDLSFMAQDHVEALERILQAVQPKNDDAVVEFLTALRYLKGDFDFNAARHRIERHYLIPSTVEMASDWVRLAETQSDSPNLAIGEQIEDKAPQKTSPFQDRFQFLIGRLQLAGDYNLMILREPDEEGNIHVLGEAKLGPGGFRALRMGDLEKLVTR